MHSGIFPRRGVGLHDSSCNMWFGPHRLSRLVLHSFGCIHRVNTFHVGSWTLKWNPCCRERCCWLPPCIRACLSTGSGGKRISWVHKNEFYLEDRADYLFGQVGIIHFIHFWSKLPHVTCKTITILSAAVPFPALAFSQSLAKGRGRRLKYVWSHAISSHLSASNK
jgi:hypothetical protein